VSRATGSDPNTRSGQGGAGAASVAVFVTFALNGFNFASWAARLPAVRDALDMRPEQVGLLLLVASIGALSALPLSGVVVQRLGARRTIVAFATVNTAGLVIAGTGTLLQEVWVVLPALVLFGVGTAVWDAAMSIEGAAVEQRLGRSIMPRFHAGFSFGTMAGAGVAAVAAAWHLTVLAHLAGVLGVSLVAVVVSARFFLPDGTHDVANGPDDGSAGHGAPRSRSFGAWTERRTVLIGLVVMAAALTEGAANDWIALAVVDGFETDHQAGAIAFALFVTGMTGMRLLGTGLLDRWGRVWVLRLAAGLSLVGLAVFGLAPGLPLALVGAVLWGMGAALGFPVGMSAAADEPARAASRVAVVATIGYTAFLAGPPLLGFLAGFVGYRHSLLAIGLPVLVGLLVVRAATPIGQGRGARTADVGAEPVAAGNAAARGDGAD
jgi:MFS family permease